MSIFEPKPRTVDYSDPKWAHPEMRYTWIPAQGQDVYAFYDDDSLTFEEKVAIEEKMAAENTAYSINIDNGYCDVKEYLVPGCPEEPETQAKVLVYTPKNLSVDKARTLFYIPGGGHYQVEPSTTTAYAFSKRFDCIIVMPVYRTMLRAKFPGAINDCHAAYKWMVDNAEELHVDPDNVVIHGFSSGGHLTAAIPFRLMRYGYSPRGVVPVMPVTDERCFTRSSHMCVGICECMGERLGNFRYVGADRFASPELGPEAFANHATVDDCIGYPPLFLHTGEFDIERDESLQFAAKVQEAQSFVETHNWGGVNHMLFYFDQESVPMLDRINATIEANIEDCFKYDFRRPWVYEGEKA
jgi:acetyl esterase/lipase